MSTVQNTGIHSEDMDRENVEVSTSVAAERRKLYGDKLVLRGLRFHGFHGVHKEEKQRGQIFLVDVDAWLDLKRAGKTDNLEDTVSYTDIYRTVKELVEGPCVDLLETLANSIALTIFERFPRISDLRIQVGKPEVATQMIADYMGIEIYRTSPAKTLGHDE